jgi:hypothetical protein
MCHPRDQCSSLLADESGLRPYLVAEPGWDGLAADRLLGNVREIRVRVRARVLGVFSPFCGTRVVRGGSTIGE